MGLIWENVEKSYIFGFDPQTIIKTNSTRIDKVYLFDLDYTLIKTKSGKKFPTSKNDWEFLVPSVPSKLTKLTTQSNCVVGIISNQGGLKTENQIGDWIDKLNQINKQIKVDFVFASVGNDRFRKPLDGSYEFIKKKLQDINWTKLEGLSKIYYVGDAFGRTDDFSDTDIKYAINCGFKPKTPEIFFGIGIKSQLVKSANITYPVINYYNSVEQNDFFQMLFNIIETHPKVLVMTIGLPASGKSFLRKELIKKFPQFTYSNNDDANEKVQSRSLLKKISSDYNYVIDDNTNLKLNERESKLKKFKSHYKIGIWFDYDLEVCWHLNWMRMYWFGAKLLPKVSYYTLNKHFDKNNLNVEFDAFIKVDKVFKDFNFNTGIKYYF